MIAALFAFVIASLLIELTPGPNMTYLAILAAARGRAPGLDSGRPRVGGGQRRDARRG